MQPQQQESAAHTLLSLARDDKAAEITALLKAGMPAGLGNKMGQTALHVAALWGNAAAAQALLDGGADANQQNARGSTPLHFAAAAKREPLAMCSLLLAAGGDATLPDLAGYLPYEQAESPEVRLLLGGPDQRLFDFAEQGRTQELQELLAAEGAVPSLKVVDAEGRHVLNMAIAKKQAGVVQLLLEADPELALLPDMTGHTPLHYAAQTGDEALVRDILSRGQARPQQLQLDMQSLNMCEYSTGQWLVGDEAVMPLDKTPLHLAVEAGHAGIVAALLAAGANPNMLDYDGAAPLHLAVEAQDEEVAEALLVGGANVNQPNKDVTSALHAAAQRGPLTLLQLLLAHKADACAASERGGWTPLHLAARAGAAKKAECLLEHLQQAGSSSGPAAAAAAVAAGNDQGNTALHLAAVNGHRPVVELLLAAGADPSAANKEGRSAADMAKTPELAAVLRAAAEGGSTEAAAGGGAGGSS